MALSRGLMLMGDDLNDYIAPSQACVLPPVQQPQVEEAGSIQIHKNGEAPPGEKVSIRLEDCLACSGCVTSAEAILVQQQSAQEVLDVLAAKEGRLVVASVSPQSQASLATKYGLSLPEVTTLISQFLSSIGVDIVLDIVTARDVALLTGAKEFIHRFHSPDPAHPLPILSSSCPGWICYAEKTHPHTLPFMSAVKSPQQIIGSYIKDHIGAAHQRSPDQVYHVSIMPCYDKKLEASRSDFYNDIYSTRDVDCVVTTGELESMFETSSVPIAPSSIAQPVIPIARPNARGSPSGGYLEFIFAYVAHSLFGIDGVDVSSGRNCSVKTIRNADMKEIVLERDGQVLLRFASCYGFRNIQNLMRKMKSKRCTYHYVEVMACPSGCINGGGQLKAPDAMPVREWLALVSATYHTAPSSLPTLNPEAESMAQQWLGGWDTEKAQASLFTQYHAIAPSSALNPLATTW